MVMILAILFTSLLVMILSAFALNGASSPVQGEPRPLKEPEAPRPQFFSNQPGRPPATLRFPREFILSQIERHVRLEQAAAEEFLGVPVADRLHCHTSSPLRI